MQSFRPNAIRSPPLRSHSSTGNPISLLVWGVGAGHASGAVHTCRMTEPAAEPGTPHPHNLHHASGRAAKGKPLYLRRPDFENEILTFIVPPRLATPCRVACAKKLGFEGHYMRPGLIADRSRHIASPRIVLQISRVSASHVRASEPCKAQIIAFCAGSVIL